MPGFDKVALHPLTSSEVNQVYLYNSVKHDMWDLNSMKQKEAMCNVWFVLVDQQIVISDLLFIVILSHHKMHRTQNRSEPTTDSLCE